MEILERVGPPHQVGVRVGRRTIVGVGLLAAAALDHAGGAREHVKRRLGQDGGARAGHQHHLQQEDCGQGLVGGWALLSGRTTFDLFGQSSRGLFMRLACVVTRHKDNVSSQHWIRLDCLQLSSGACMGNDRYQAIVVVVAKRRSRLYPIHCSGSLVEKEQKLSKRIKKSTMKPVQSGALNYYNFPACCCCCCLKSLHYYAENGNRVIIKPCQLIEHLKER